jgi:hypothetical protein
MGMLNRYQKAGGFVQLINLIETCGKEKQDKFLDMIESEDPSWAQAIKEKMLSVKRIFSWPLEAVGEIIIRLPELTIATALHGLSDEDWVKASATLSHSQKRNIEDLKAAKNPAAGEVTASFAKIINEVRDMITHGYLRMDKIDAALIIEEGIEEKIGVTVGLPPSGNRTQQKENSKSDASSQHVKSAKTETSVKAQNSPQESPPSGNPDMSDVLQRVAALTNENKRLRVEIGQLKDKITQIKKLAA